MKDPVICGLSQGPLTFWKLSDILPLEDENESCH